MGLLVEALRERGIEAYGVDISEYALQQVPAAIRPFCWQGSATDPFPQRYDLIVCIEVLEHMPQADSERALRNLCQSTDDVLFSSSPVDRREPTHFNVQPPDYWAQLFAEQGLWRDTAFDAGFVQPWSARFRRDQDPWPRRIAGYERLLWQLRYENAELRQAAIESRQKESVLEQTTAAATAEASDWRDRVTAAEQALAAMRQTMAWKLMQLFGGLRRRAIPQGSGREAIVGEAPDRTGNPAPDEPSR
jgi:hypothetical protein